MANRKKPLVVVTRKLPDRVETRMRELFDAQLNLDDKLAAYVDGIPNGEKITLRQLLGMTSGIYDFTGDQQFGKDFAANPLMPFGPQDVVAIVKRHVPEFVPGAKVAYCDTNYVLLGVVLEKAAGKSAAQVIEEQILTPLKLRDTSFPATAMMPVPRRGASLGGPIVSLGVTGVISIRYA